MLTSKPAVQQTVPLVGRSFVLLSIQLHIYTYICFHAQTVRADCVDIFIHGLMLMCMFNRSYLCTHVLFY